MSSLYLPPHHSDIPLRPDGRPYPAVRPRALNEEAKAVQQRMSSPDSDWNLRRVRWPLLVAAVVGAGLVLVASQVLSVLP